MSKTADVLDDLFAGIDSNSSAPSTTPAPSTTKSEADLLAEIDRLTATGRPTSRPTTPRSTIRKSFEGRRPIITNSELPIRRSGDGYGINTNLTRRDPGDVTASTSLRQTPVDIAPPALAVTPPAATVTTPQASAGGGGWWGSIFTTATTALETAQAAAAQAQTKLTELQKSEETRKWTTQATNLLDSAQNELRTRAIPTLSNFLHTIAPPIASHEQLRIHITHDIQNYPSIDTIVFGVFDRVMQQVEGGDLLVVQKGREAKPRSSLGSGWASGPWYKSPEPRMINALVSSGLEEGVKLARVSAEAYAQEYATGNPTDPIQDAHNPSNPTRKSDIFLSIQPITHPSPAYLQHSNTQDADQDDDSDDESNFTTFALHLLDPRHNIAYSTISQSIPVKWLNWLDYTPHPAVHPDIAVIVGQGGVDPREWVVEWVEETLGLAVGVLAQRYVARRMNVGVYGREKGKVKAGEQQQEVEKDEGKEKVQM